MTRPRRPVGHPRDSGNALDFLRLLWAIEHLLRSASKRMHRRLGITGPQRLVLRMVERFPGIGSGDLARILHLHPSTLTGVIARLSRRRLILRDRDASDGRRIRLRPVPGSGATSGRLTIEDAVGKALTQVPPARARDASLVLEGIVASLEAHLLDPGRDDELASRLNRGRRRRRVSRV